MLTFAIQALMRSVLADVLSRAKERGVPSRKYLLRAATAAAEGLVTSALTEPSIADVRAIVASLMGDSEQADQLADALLALGTTGLVAVQSSSTKGVSIDSVEGLRFPASKVARVARTSEPQTPWVLDRPAIAVFGEGVTLFDVQTALRTRLNRSRPAVVVATSGNPELVERLGVWAVRHKNVYPATVVSVGQQGRGILQDIAGVTGARVMEHGMAGSRALARQSWGRAGRVTLGSSETTFVGAPIGDSPRYSAISSEVGEPALLVHVGAVGEFAPREELRRVEQAVDLAREALSGVVTADGPALHGAHVALNRLSNEGDREDRVAAAVVKEMLDGISSELSLGHPVDVGTLPATVTASALIEAIKSARISKIAAVERKPPQPPPPEGAAPDADDERQPRWLLSKVFEVSDSRLRTVRRAFRAATEHEVAVMIGSSRRGWMAAQGGPSVDDLLPKRHHEVAIVFAVPELDLLLTERLALPAQGPTEERRFRFWTGAPGSQVKVLISLIHAGRTLQTAEWSGTAASDPATVGPDGVMKFKLACVTPQLGALEKRMRFDGTIQIARAPDGHLVGIATVDPPQSIGLGDLGEAVAGIRELLGKLTDPEAYGSDLTSHESVDFLRRLAWAGGMLDVRVGAPLRKLVDNSEIARIQVVQTDPDLFVPVEFVYDLPPPVSAATLCKNWRNALETGKCDPSFHHLDEDLGHLNEVCPSGFWAVAKVIERQSVEQHELTTTMKEWGRRSEPGLLRSHLQGFQAALFAWSEKVNNAVDGQSDGVRDTLKAVTAGNTTPVETWRAWARAVKEKSPSLLVLLSHTTDDVPAMLEIGAEESGECLAVAQLNGRLVKTSDEHTPIVLLLGCDTAIPDRAAYSFAARFRECGASVVVGTLTSVLGEHAAPVASALVKGLSEAAVRTPSGGPPDTFGEVWRRTRNRLLAQGELTSLCVTAFGDAGWLVGAPSD